ncbi:MAG: transcription antitermination factor NusB [Acidobacteriota bacterium]|nr:transcription antitermination factor NusB [Acidobacteriota bacterium]MDE3162111.1 transcription antitermination factor NusB [Acidobacteriota bacterium]
MQMLFQADVGKQSPDQVRTTFWKAAGDVEPEVRGFAEDLFRVAIAEHDRIDDLIVANSRHWRLERMSAVDRNLLRMSIGEMLGFKGTPFPIIINEALEIGRRFSAPESINFLNGMLDAIAHSLLSQQEPPR